MRTLDVVMMNETNQKFIQENDFYRAANTLNTYYHNARKQKVHPAWLLKNLRDFDVEELRSKGVVSVVCRKGRGFATYDVFKISS